MQEDSSPLAADVERVFGRERLRMATGEHVEVWREAAVPGTGVRYSKRFLATSLGDFRPWTEREWQILQRLASQAQGAAAHAAPRIAGFTAADGARPAELQTFDAGVTVEHWTTLRPTHPDRPAARHVFEDCAHWWALAHHCLRALDALHGQGIVHLDLKADNICIPWDRARSIQPASGEVRALRFGELKLIDFAFAVFTGEMPALVLPLDRQTRYEYQSPRLLDALGAGRRGLLEPTRALDWRCDFFSLAAMLWRYLPEPEERSAASWSDERHAQAGVLVRRLLDEHHADLPAERPHAELIALTRVLLNQADLAASLRQGWTFTAREDGDEAAAWQTPLTRVSAAASAVVAATPAAASAASRSADPPASPPAGRAEQPEHHPAADRFGAAADPGDWVATELPPRLRHRPPKRRAAQIAQAAAVLAGAAVLGYAWWAFEPPPLPDRASLPAATPDPMLARGPADAGIASAPATPAPAASAPSALPLPEPPGDASRPSSGVPPPVAGAPAPSGPGNGSVAPAAAAPPIVSTPPAVADAAGPASGSVVQQEAIGPSAGPIPAPSLPRDRAETGAPSSVAGAGSGETRAPTPPEPAEPPQRVEPGEPSDAQVNRLLTVLIPQVAAWAEGQLAPVLRSTVRTDLLPRREELRGAVAAARLGPGRPEMRLSVRAPESRRLNELARTAYWDRNDVREAVRLQVRAFAANPLDSEVVGNLAFLRMREQPPQIRAARQLALHSLTLPDTRYPLGRVQDWTTLAISNALLGRDADARHAWYISMVLAPDRQRHRNAALRAVSIYGERLRPSVEAMLRREFPPERGGLRSGGRRQGAES